MNQVIVIPYQSTWPSLFESEANRFREILGPHCLEVHHIGSTSVPGLAAKPIIDLIPVVDDLSVVDSFSEKIAQAGYEIMGEYGIPFRRFFRKRKEGIACNVHLFPSGYPEIERHILFRDFLRKHPEKRDAYAHLKMGLAQQHPNDMRSYILGKEEFIFDGDEAAGWKGYRMVEVLTPREEETYRKFKNEIDLPELNTKRLVLSKGRTIIGAACVASKKLCWIQGDRDEESSIQNYFLPLIQRWISMQNAFVI